MNGIREDCYWYDYWQDMNERIPFCKLQKVDEFLETCDGCEKYHSKYKKTNANRIRSMTDEELATMIATLQIAQTLARQDETWWLDWLKQPVDSRHESVPETTTDSRSCATCRFCELRERYENKQEPYCTAFCRWIGNTVKCGEWMEKEDHNGTRND